MSGNTKLCLHPWVQFHLKTNGDVGACCNSSFVFGNVQKDKLEKIWNSDEIKKFRKQFLNGETPSECERVCHNKEKDGGGSLRMETNSKFWSKLPEILSATQEDGAFDLKPIYWDLRFSNVCNLRCRTCWHGASSSWFEESKKLRNQASDKAIIKAVNSIDDFIKQLLELGCPDEIYFAGGEPMVIEEHYLLLEKLIQSKMFPKLRYNTNLSFLEFKRYSLIELWDNFEVELLISTDAVNELNDFIRKDADYKKIESNLNLLKANFNNQIEIKLSPTFSWLNTYRFPELLESWYQNGWLKKISDFHVNILQRPQVYSLQVLPQESKLQITRKLIKLTEKYSDIELKNKLGEIISFMNAKEIPFPKKGFKKYNQKIDELRNEDTTKQDSFFQFLNQVID